MADDDLLREFLRPLPCLTGDLPGVGGTIKQTPEDFVVEEIPAYQPCGQGEHLYLWMEKRDVGAEFFQRQIAQRLGIRPEEIGMAGMKDRQAVTRQWVSVPASAEAGVGRLDGDGMKVLATSKHSNKLKPGHLRGNRFTVRIRGVDPAAGPLLDASVRALRVKGLPNYYGEQRFGRGGETLLLGWKLLRREADTHRRFLRKLALSAVQSALFNVYLARRLADGLLHRVLVGDVLAKWPVGGMFVARDAAIEQARFDAREVVSAGPMFGAKTFPAKDAARLREEEVLASAELTPASFAGFGKLLQGTRRHNLVYVDDLAAELAEGVATLSFSLPAGSYATVLLREITKVGEPG